MFNFEKGDHVAFTFGSVFSPNPDGIYQAVVNGGKITARRGCGSSGGPEYRVAGFSGWWAEENLVLVSRGSKNSPSCEEAGGPNKDKLGEPKLNTEDSGKARGEAEWIPHQEEDRIEYECSSCRWMALNDYRGRSTDSLYCPHCGKYMTNSTMPLEDE